MKGITYNTVKLKNGCCEINKIAPQIGFFKNIEELYIPSEINGLKVIGISRNAAKSLQFHYYINKLIVPKTIGYISDSAFSYVNINEVIFEEDSEIQKIAYSAFAYTHIKKLDINSKKPLSIGSLSFTNSHLEELDLRKCLNIKSFGEACFSSSYIQTIKLPANVKDLSNAMFRDNSITDISFLLDLDECSTIPQNCFSSCYITSIPDEVFKQYHIEAFAFEDNEFEELELPEYAKVEHEAFMFNNQLKKVITNIPIIPNFLFHSCQVLETVIIRNATEIHSNAFRSCSIKNLIFEDNKIQIIEEEAFSSNKLEELSLEHTNLRILGDRAFANNYLASVELPYFISEISKTAFDNNFLLLFEKDKLPFVNII